ncbi:MAG TPA: hypothetical protein VF342_17525 [Alphaproteobacteria bacterium]
MEHRTLNQTRELATVHPALRSTPMSKQERLLRWAELLDQRGESVRTLHETEFAPRRIRHAMREDDSALTVAFQDPVLRGEGLSGDTYGDAVRFFRLSESEAHRILCYCHYGRLAVPCQAVADRIRDVALGSRNLPVSSLALATAASAAAFATAGLALAAF